jgi:hypothetical protein
MAISRFDYVPGQPIVNTYVPLPYEELLNNVSMKQQQYDTNKAYENMLVGQLAKVKAREEDIPALKGINKKYEDELTTIANDVMKDYGSSQYKERISKLSNTLANDLSSGHLYALNSNYQNYEGYNKMLQDYKEGPLKQYLIDNFEGIESKTKGGGYAGYLNPDGSFNIQRAGNIDKYIDREKSADDIVKGINSLGYSDFKISGPDKFGNQYLMDAKGEYIDASKVRNTFRPLFKQSEGYKQLRREAELLSKQQGIDPDAYVDNAMNQLEQGVVSKYVYSKSDKGGSIHSGSEWQYGAGQEALANNLAPTTSTSATVNPLKPEMIEIDEEGKVANTVPMMKDSDWYLDGKQISILEAADLKRSGHKVPGLTSVLKPEVQAKINNTTQTIQAVKKNYKDMLGKTLTDNEAANLYNKAAEKSGLVILKDKNFTPNKSQFMTDMVLGGKNTVQGLQGQPIAIIGDEKTGGKTAGQKITFNELLEHIGVSDSNPIVNSKIQGRLLYNPYFPGAYKAIVTTKDGKSHEIAVGANQQESAFFEPVNKIASSALSGKDVSVKVNDGLMYKTRTIPTEEGFKVMVDVLSRGGNTSMSLDDFIDTQHDVFESAYKPMYTTNYGTTKEQKQVNTSEELDE